MTTRVFNQVARTYDDDWSGLYVQSRRACYEQIMRAVGNDRPLRSAVDLAIGTGNFYQELAGRLNIDQRYGLDNSPGMLKVAKAKLDGGVNLVCDTALNAEAHVGPGSQDLVICHFLLSFVDPAELLPMAHRLLKPGGLLSLATSTQRSLEQLYAGRFHRAGKLLGVRRAIERAYTPVDHEGCLGLLDQHGFEVVDAVLQHRSVVFRDFADARAWGLESGWAAGYLDGALGWRQYATRLAFTAAEVLWRPLYPVQATNEVSIVLGRVAG